MPKLRMVHVETSHPNRTTSSVVTMPRFEVPLFQRVTTDKVMSTKENGGAPQFTVHALTDAEISESNTFDAESPATTEAHLRAKYGNALFDAAYPDGFKAEYAAVVKRDTVGTVNTKPDVTNEFEALPQLSPRAVEDLGRAGILSLAELASATPETVQTALGVGLAAADKLRADATAAIESTLIPAQE